MPFVPASSYRNNYLGQETIMFSYMKYLLITILFVFAINTSAAAQQIEKADSDIQTRVKQLETQLLELKAELEKLKQPAAASTAVVEKTADPGPASKTADKAATTSNAAKSDGKNLTINAGDLKITPYGIIFFNAFSNSGGTNNTDVPLWATAGTDGDAGASGRQTRFGVRIDGGSIGNANVKAVVEADFYGGFPAIGVGENFGVVRLRLANVRMDWEKTSLVLGQDWIPFAPNSPQSLASAAIPQMAAAGNPWSRLPQARVEQRFGKGFTWQGAILAPGTGDFPSTGAPALLQPGSGASSRIPFLQSRLAYSNSKFFGTGKAGTIGIAGHYGRSRVTVGNNASTFDSVGVAADWNVPLAKRLSLTGEAFFGRNLGGFQAGVFQGYNTDFAYRQGNVLVGAGVRGIGTRGGWTQLGFNLPAFEDKLTVYGSIGVDDPRNEDLLTLSGRNFRSRNLVYAFNGIYKVTPQLSFAAEFRRFDTSYLFSADRQSTHVNLAGTYVF